MHNYNNVLILNQHVAGSYGNKLSCNVLSVSEVELLLTVLLFLIAI